MCIQFTVEEETNLNTRITHHKDGFLTTNAYILQENTHADRYLDSTIFDPQSGSGTTLLLQTEKICNAVPDRQEKYACMFCGPSTTVAIPEAYTCQELASLYTPTLQLNKEPPKATMNLSYIQDLSECM